MITTIKKITSQLLLAIGIRRGLPLPATNDVLNALQASKNAAVADLENVAKSNEATATVLEEIARSYEERALQNIKQAKAMRDEAKHAYSQIAAITGRVKSAQGDSYLTATAAI